MSLQTAPPHNECFESHVPYRNTAELYFVPDRPHARPPGGEGRNGSLARNVTPDKAATVAEVMTKTRHVPGACISNTIAIAIAIAIAITIITSNSRRMLP
jgi:hypothetical protein